MAEALHPDIQAALNAGRVIIDRAVSFDLPSGTYGLWTGEGTLTDSGLTFVGGGDGVVSISDIGTNLEGVPNAMEIILTATEGGRFDTTNLVDGIETEDYNGRPMAVFECYFNPDTGALLGNIRQVWVGVIDEIRHREDGSRRQVIAIGEQKAQFDLTMSPQATRSDASQRLRNPNDGFLRHVNSVSRPVYWGRLPPAGTGT